MLLVRHGAGSTLVGEVGNHMVGFTSLGIRMRLHGRRGLHSFQCQLCRELLLEAFQVEGVVQLEGEDELPKLHLSVASGEYSTSSGDGQVRICVGNVRTLPQTPLNRINTQN